MSQETLVWDGLTLGPGPVVLLLCESAVPDAAKQPRILGAASDGTTSVVLLGEQLSLFLREHESVILVTYDAAALHWRLASHFGRTNDAEALNVLWAFSRDSRLVDVALLDQRFRLVTKGVHPSPRPLQNLASEYGVSLPAGPAVISTDSCQQIGCQVKAVLDIYQESDRRITALISQLRIPPELACRLGPLGHGLDVQGAIAVGRPGNTLNVAVTGAVQLQAALERAYRQSSDVLSKDPLVKKIFTWQLGQVARNENGHVRWKEGQLREWLAIRADEMHDLNQRPFDQPLDDKGRVSLHPEHWGDLVQFHPLLRAWSNLALAAGLERAFRAAVEQWRLSVRYRVVPHLYAYSPDLDESRALADGVFQPAPGRQFAVCKLRDLYLRCLAVVSERHQHVGKLAQMFRDGDDPAEQLAEELCELFQRPTASTTSGSSRLRWADRIAAERWADLARLLLLSVPQGLAAVHTRELLREVLPDIELSELEMQSLQATFFRNVCPELEAFPADDTIRQLADRTGADFALFCRKLLEEFPTCEPSPRALEAAVCRAFRKDAGEGVVRILKSVARDPAIQQTLTRGELLALLRKWPVTLFGQVGQPTIGGQSRARECGDLADGIMKRISFELASGGYLVVAVTRDEVVVEVARDDDHAEERVEGIVSAAIQQLWGMVPEKHLPRRGVPIVCDCFLTDRW